MLIVQLAKISDETNACGADGPFVEYASGVRSLCSDVQSTAGRRVSLNRLADGLFYPEKFDIGNDIQNRIPR